MRLIKLKLENFATYRNITVDFSSFSYPLFVVGNTGAGKTTLFVDAITAALYGLAYGEMKKKGLVIRKGCPSARVCLEFECEDKHFRISRTFHEGRSSEAVLEEFTDGRWRTMTLSTSSVDEELKKIIGMDYKVMLNSVIVRQGEVESFIEAKPHERREFLFRIFRINFRPLYDEAKRREDELRERVNRLEIQIEEKEKRINEEKKLREELDNRLSKKEKLEEEKRKLNEIQSSLKMEIKNIESRLNKLNAKRGELELLKKQLEERKNEKKEVQRRLEIENEKIRQYSIEKLQRLDEYKEKFNNYLYYSNLLSEASGRIKWLEQLMEKKMKLEGLRKEHQNILKEKPEEMLKTTRSKINEIISKIEGIKKEIEMIKERNSVLSESKGKCPVCEQVLPDDRRETLLRHLNKEKKEKDRQLAKLEEERKNLEKKVDLYEHRVNKERDLRARIAELEEDVASFDEEEYRNLKRKASELEKNIKTLKKEIEDFIGFPFDDVKEVSEAFKKMDDAASAVEKVNELNQEIENLSGEILSLEERIKDERQVIGEIEELKNRKESLEREVSEVGGKLQQISKEIGANEQRINDINKELQEIDSIKKELERLRKKLKDEKVEYLACSLLREIFSPSHLPVKILEDYLQVIENYVKNYLKVFSPNIDVKIELKGVRSDESQVDIIVMSDEYARDLCTYSGGESTLVGFAFRIGIGKALAELVAGTKRPRFLIIDEGFGPLDEELRQKVADALLSLYPEEYQQIIVISHHEDLRSHPSFRTVIEVYKNDEGISNIQIPTLQ